MAVAAERLVHRLSHVICLNRRTLPGVNDGNIIVNDHIAALDVAVSDQREVGLALLESYGPVDEVQLMFRQPTKTSIWSPMR